MSLIGNILWFLLFGLEMGLAWIVTGLVFCCTIIITAVVCPRYPGVIPVWSKVFVALRTLMEP